MIGMAPFGSNNKGDFGGLNGAKIRECNNLRAVDAGPEKAGVGGSIPSLATI